MNLMGRPVRLLTSAATGCGRIMGGLFDCQIAHRNHERGRDALPRVLADQQVGPTRFMESVKIPGYSPSPESPKAFSHEPRPARG